MDKLQKNSMLPLYHDMGNHIAVLKSICEKGIMENKQDECLKMIDRYLDSITEKYEKTVQNIDSGNITIDLIIRRKLEEANSKNILMVTRMYIPKDMSYNSLDFVIILGNLLDNAIESCELCNNKNSRNISLDIRYAANNLVILLENTYNGMLDGEIGSSVQGKLLETSKVEREFHGICMRNIIDIVNKYDGEMRWKAAKGVFRTEVLLYGFDAKKTIC